MHKTTAINVKSNNTCLFKKGEESHSFIQPKLSIGRPNNKYEAEADRIADEVVSMSSTQKITNRDIGTSVQRKCTDCNEEDHIQKKSLAETITPLIQRSIVGLGREAQASDAVNSKISNSRGGGSLMSNNTLGFMENSFDTDFSNVKIHTDSNAIQLNKELNAQAFTVGNDIYFNEGKYSPNSSTGKHLLAHELTHTLQQQNQLMPRSIQRQEAETGNDSQSTNLGPIAGSRLLAVATMESAIQQVEEAIASEQTGTNISTDVTNALNRFFPGEDTSFLSLLLRRMQLVRRLLPTIAVRRIRQSAIDIAVDPYAFRHQYAIDNGVPAAAYPPDFIAVYQNWYSEPDLRATRLIHEVFHYAYPFVRNHNRRSPRSNAYAYQGFVSILGGLTTGGNLERQYPLNTE